MPAVFGLTEAQCDVINDWLVNELNISVVFAGQSNIQGNKPLATVGVVFPPSQINHRPDTKRNGTTTNKLKFYQDCTLSIMVKDNINSSMYVNMIEKSLHKNVVKQLLHSQGLYFKYSHPIVNTHNSLSDKMEYTSIIDIKFGMASEIEEERDIIETVQIIYEEDL